LIELLDSENQRNVGFAVEALGRIGTEAEAAIPKLVSLVGNREHSASALSALSLMGEAAVPSLIELYRNGSGSRFFIAKALMKQGVNAAAAVPWLRKDLGSEKTGVVVVAAMTLGSIGVPAKPAVEELLALIRNSKDPHVRVRVAEAVWRLDRNTNVVAPIMIEELSNWSKEPNALSRQTIDSYGESRVQVAVNILEEVGPAAREAIPYLKLMSRSSFEAQRTAATRALNAIGGD
jgi:HEAT repeat protein